MLKEIFTRLTAFATQSRFRGFSAFAALFMLVIVTLFTWFFSQGSFDPIIKNFSRLKSQQFFIIVMTILVGLFIFFLSLVVLAFISEHPVRRRKGDAVIYIVVHEKDDRTAVIANAEVTLALAEPVKKITSENGATNFTVSGKYVGQELTINAKKAGFENRHPLQIKVRDGIQEFIDLEPKIVEGEHEIKKGEAGNTPLAFANIVIDHRNRYWREYPELASTRRGYPFDRVCGQYFGLTKGVANADPSFDITVINKANEPIILSAIGIEILSAARVEYPLHVGGTVPEAVRLKKGDAVVVCVPELAMGNPFDPDQDVWVDVHQLVTSQLPDPIYIQDRAPFRYTLILSGLAHQVSNHIILRMWAKTSQGDTVSHQIAVGYHLEYL